MIIRENVWIVSWEDVEDFVNLVADYFKNTKVSGVYGIPRGGSIIASLLSYKMNIPILYAPYKECIVMDDISDSGETLLHFDKNSSDNGKKKGYHICTMFYKESSLVKPELYMHIKKDSWIVYPWEGTVKTK